MKYRRTSKRPDRTTEPHSRIPDAIYFDVLPYLTSSETKLWLALKSREWRKDGTRRGIVKKSLNRIALDIRMSRPTVQHAFSGLREKGVAEWAGFGIRLLEPSFTTAVTTGFTTEEHRRRRPKNVPGVARKLAASDCISWPATTVIPFTPNENGCGRSVITIRRARDEPTHAVDLRDDSADPASRKSARASARSSRALPDNSHSSGKDKAEVPDETILSNELDARPLDRETMHRLMREIRARAEAAAEEGAAKRDAGIAAERKKDAARRAELKRQAEELIAAEKGETP
jgi:hypothetical protein